MLACPSCGDHESKVVDSRPTPTKGCRRRRQCLGCDARYTTYEAVYDPSGKTPEEIWASRAYSVFAAAIGEAERTLLQELEEKKLQDGERREKWQHIKREQINLRKHLRDLIMSQEWLCGICGNTLPGDPSEINIDHIVPRSRGGSDDLSNLHAVCVQCNMSKGTRTMDELNGSA